MKQKWSVILNDSLSAAINPPMRLDATHAYSVVLVSGELVYSWYNISVALGNNTFEYSTDGITYVIETIPDGVWSSCELILHIETIINAVIPIVVPTVPAVPNITIQQLYYNGTWRISTNNGFYFNTGSVGTLIGFTNNQIIPPTTPTGGAYSTQFMGIAKSINISCNLVDNTRNHHSKGNSSILFSTATPTVNPWEGIRLVNSMPWSVQAIQTSTISKVSINILDHDLRDILLNDPRTSFWIEITDEGRILEASHSVASI